MRTKSALAAALALAIGTFGWLATEARAQDGTAATKPVELTGEWRLDPAHSDMPPAGGGERSGGAHGGHGEHGGYGGGGGGGWGGHHGGEGASAGSGGGGAGSGGRSARLPALIHITQTPSLVSFEDSSGVVLQEIATVAAVADTMTRAPGALHVAGTWAAGTLTVSHEGPRGKVTETWKLEPSGAALDQVVAFESPDMGSRTMKRVYRRVEAD